MFTKPKRRVEKVFIHCSDSDYKIHDDIKVIREWHVKENGWKDIGYHYFIKQDGQIQAGRDLEKIPAAQFGHNTGSIAICLAGKNKFYEAQYLALQTLCKIINLSYDKITFHGHCEIDKARTCPNFPYIKVLKLVNGKLGVF